MKRVALLCLFLTALITGCSSSEPSNIAADASEEALAEYERLIAEADSELAGDEEDTTFEE